MKKSEINKRIKDLKEKDKETKLIKIVTNSKEDSKLLKSELKQIKKANKTPKGDKALKNKPGNIIDVTNVSKTYVTGKMKFKALNNISLEIKRGDFAVILGQSGSGKSTLLNILSGLDRPTSGDIVVNDINISTLNNNGLTTFRRNYVGFVFQSYNLLLELNAKDNAALGRHLQKDGNKRLDLKELFERVGIGDKMNKSITELSGGQLQRVSIIRALSKNPEVIFADEPTGALDSKTSQKVLELFVEINKRYKTTIVFVTHDIEITKLATRIIKVNDGQISTITK